MRGSTRRFVGVKERVPLEKFHELQGIVVAENAVTGVELVGTT